MNSRAVDPALDRTAIQAALADERRRLADHVADLTEEEWSTPSLCEAWTVRDVIAHLGTTTRTSAAKILREAIRARGSFDRMEIALAAERVASYPSDELVAQLRESADSTRRMFLSAAMDPLMDVVIHAQDISRPLGKSYRSPAEVVSACLAYVARNNLMGGPKRLAGVTVVSTDTGWRSGEGPELRGRDEELLLVAAGRAAGLPTLTGAGLDVVAARLAAR